jgi:flagellar hook-associated protein 2
MSITPLTFTGVSSFSNDFQTILTRAVQIAEVPVTSLTNQETDIQSEKVLASNLSASVATLASSLGDLATLGKTHAAVATSSDTSVVTATATGVTSGASYAITNVTSVARAAAETSLSGYAGWQTSAAYTTLTGDASTPDQQSLTFTIDDSSGVAQTQEVDLTGGTAGLTGADAASAINTALQATGNSALMGIAASYSGGTIKFSSNSSTSFSVAFGAVSGADTTGGFAAAQSTTQTSVAAPVSSTGTVEIDVGGAKTRIVLDSDNNNLAGLSAAINNLNLGVTASVLSTGTGNTPNYLSVSANQTGLTTLTLVDDPDGAATSLLTDTNQGANTVFDLNGLEVTKSSATVSDVVPGVTFTFAGTTTSDETVNVSINSDNSKLSAALQSVVANYNTLSGLVNAQIGPSAGLLSGSPLISQARQAMFSLMDSTTTSSGMESLASLGIELDNSGVMSFNSDTFNALTGSQLNGAYGFLASTTTGPTAMQSKLTQLSDPTTGSIEVQQNQWDATDKRLADQVTTLTGRINAMQTSLESKLAVADTLLASLASQQNILTASIQSLNFTSYGYQTSSPSSSSSSSS